jgi:TonB family protein
MQTKSIYTMKDLIKNPLRHRSFFLRLGFAISFGLLLLAFRWAPDYETKAPMRGRFEDEDFRIEMKNVKIKKEQNTAKDQRKARPQADNRLANLHIDSKTAEKREESGREKDEPEEGPLFSPDSNIRNQIGPLDTLEAPPLDVAEVMPSFPGGLTALYAFIRSQIRYPPRERELGIEGTVYLKFVVDRTGRVSNIRVLRAASRGLNEEAIRCIRQMPRWTPGRQNGRRVSVYFTLPIQFLLD